MILPKVRKGGNTQKCSVAPGRGEDGIMRQNLEILCLHFITKPILYQGCGDKSATPSNDGLMMDFADVILPNAAE